MKENHNEDCRNTKRNGLDGRRTRKERRTQLAVKIGQLLARYWLRGRKESKDPNDEAEPLAVPPAELNIRPKHVI